MLPTPICKTGHALVVLKSFFDGGNEADSTQYDYVSLASISGTDQQWTPFDEEWGRVLDKYSVPFLHTTDLLTFNEPYTKDSGWTAARRDEFLSECVTAIEHHLMRPNRRSRVLLEEGLMANVVTIDLNDYIRARRDNPRVPKDATMLLATQSVYKLIVQGEHLGAHFYDLFFDRSEPYMGHIIDRQKNKRTRKHIAAITDRILNITETESRAVCGLQAADLFAWCYSHAHIKVPRYRWKNRLLNHRWWVDDRYEYDSLVALVPGVPEIVDSWKLPTRRPTR